MYKNINLSKSYITLLFVIKYLTETLAKFRVSLNSSLIVSIDVRFKFHK